MVRIIPMLLTAALASNPALANEFEDLTALDRRIAELAPATPIDSRLKLRRCPEPAVLEPSSGMVAVRCIPLGWRLRVAWVGEAAAVPSVKPVIRRGQAVNVMIVGESYSVGYDGIAMDDGAVGSDIRVKFSAQGAFQTGTVIGPGKVRIDD